MQVNQITSVNNAIKLYLLGFLVLFLELVLIRYLAGNIWNLGYFPNLVLMATFIGMGIGFTFHHFFSDRTTNTLFICSAGILLFLILFIIAFHPAIPGFSTWSSTFAGDFYFTNLPTQVADENLSIFIVWFAAIICIFFMITVKMAKLFRLFRPLTAYTLDIVGSCTGILCFMLISWLSIPAFAWFILLIPLYFLIIGKKNYYQYIILAITLLLVIGFTYYQDTKLLAATTHDTKLITTIWSPYQKIEYAITKKHKSIFANGIPHQTILSAKQLKSSPYVIPYRLRKFKNILILGAGAGNDVATALMNNAKYIDAVEIDPVIAKIGEKYNLLRPYQNPKVNLIIDDGRAFMHRTKHKYDLIIFALTDSLVKISSMSQLRLETYLFTKTSVKRAYSLLKPNGLLCFYNFYRKPWIKQKIAKMLYEVTGNYPQIINPFRDFHILLAGKQNLNAKPISFKNIYVPTDNWPFLYMKAPGLPGVYLGPMIILSLLIIMLLYIQQKTAPQSYGIANIFIKSAFLLMGVAFLLLETKSIVQFSLLFGTTWLNNSLVFLAILLLILAANWIAVYLPKIFLNYIFILLLGSCFVVFIYPLENLLQISSLLLRFIAASLITFLPIFFANLIFSLSFRDQKIAEHIFGWNLLGASLGGIMEYSSLALGYNNLTIIIAVCYTLAFIFIHLALKLARS
jgi:predicted membrane-bound spermidine synthase